MHISFNLYNQAPSWWDEEVATHEGLFYSSSLWGKFHQALGIGKGRFLEVLCDGKRTMLILLPDICIEGYYLLGLPKPILKTVLMLPFLRSLNFRLQPVIIDQSILQSPDIHEYISKELITYIIRLAAKEHKNVHPAVYAGFREAASAQALLNGLGRYGSITGTARLLLTTAEEIFSHFPAKLRQNIRKAEKMGVEIKFLTPEETPLYIKGLTASYTSNNLQQYHTRFETQLTKLYPEHVMYAIACYQGEIVAGSSMYLFGSTLTESGYVTPLGRKLRVPGGDLLKWKVIQYGLSHGYRLMDFDMIDVSPDSESDKTRTISDFKLKWGGDIVYGVRISHLNALLSTVRNLKQRYFSPEQEVIPIHPAQEAVTLNQVDTG